MCMQNVCVNGIKLYRSRINCMCESGSATILHPWDPSNHRGAATARILLTTIQDLSKTNTQKSIKTPDLE